MKTKDSPHPYAAVTIIFWSLAYVLTRVLVQYFSVYSLGFLRYFIASCALAIIALFTKMRFPRIIDLGWFFLSGTTGFFFYIIAFNKGSVYVSASTSSLAIATVPVITALFSCIIYHEKIKRYQWIAIIIEFSGVMMLTLINGDFMVNKGLLWLFFAAMSLSAYNLLQRKLLKDYSALQVSTFSIFTGTFMLTIFLPGSVKEATNAMPIHILYIAILGVFPSAIAYLTWSVAFSKTKITSTVSNYMFITPFLTTLLGFLISHEIPDLPTVIGGAVILTGLFIFNFGEAIRHKFSSNK